MKYFVLGALASGMLLYGMSMIYGATGTLDIDGVAQRDRSTGRRTRPLLVFGLVFVVSGIGSSSAPCRFTCGCPTSITARRRRSRC